VYRARSPVNEQVSLERLQYSVNVSSRLKVAVTGVTPIRDLAG